MMTVTDFADMFYALLLAIVLVFGVKYFSAILQAWAQRSFLFWGLDEVLTGYLIFRSGFLPRILGVLLGISGFLYLSDPLLSFGAPAVGAWVFPSALALCLPGELLSSLWMATVGLNVNRWRTWLEPTQPAQPAGA